MHLLLVPCEPEHRPTIAGWPEDAVEARCWGGAATPYPTAPNVLDGWHEEKGNLPFCGMDQTGQLVAYGELWVDQDHEEAELARIIVQPGRRRCGVGSALVKALVSEARSRKCTEIYLRITPSNSAAIRCYQRSGFRRVEMASEQSFNEGQPVPYIWMKCSKCES